jgi:PleD family two-component response regulator
VTVSCGLAGLDPGSRKSTEGLLREADTALYRAKERGKDAVETYYDDDEPGEDAAGL